MDENSKSVVRNIFNENAYKMLGEYEQKNEL